MSLGGSGVSIGGFRILRVAIVVPSTVSTSCYTTPALESLEHGSFVICLHPSVGCFVVGWLFAGLRQINIRSLSQRVWYSMINHQRKATPLGGGSN